MPSYGSDCSGWARMFGIFSLPFRNRRISGTAVGTCRQDKYAPELIGKKLRMLRKARGRSQASLADMLGVSKQQIGKYESGIDNVPVARLLMIASELDIDPHYFWTRGSAYEGASLPKQNRVVPLLDHRVLNLIDAYKSIKDTHVRENILRLVTQLSKREEAE